MKVKLGRLRPFMYLAAVWESGASPVLVVNKTDLCEDVELLLASLGNAALGLPVAPSK